MLAVFLLIGGIWTYQRIDDEVREAVGVGRVVPTAEDQAALTRLTRARTSLNRATAEQAAARANLELRREAYRTALDVRDNRRCEGCGRDVVASCTTCGSERRVGTLHCGTCGAL